MCTHHGGASKKTGHLPHLEKKEKRMRARGEGEREREGERRREEEIGKDGEG